MRDKFGVSEYYLTVREKCFCSEQVAVMLYLLGEETSRYTEGYCDQIKMYCGHQSQSSLRSFLDGNHYKLEKLSGLI